MNLRLFPTLFMSQITFLHVDSDRLTKLVTQTSKPNSEPANGISEAGAQKIILESGHRALDRVR